MGIVGRGGKMQGKRTVLTKICTDLKELDAIGGSRGILSLKIIVRRGGKMQGKKCSFSQNMHGFKRFPSDMRYLWNFVPQNRSLGGWE